MSSSAHIDNKKRHIRSWKRTNTRIRTYTNCGRMYSINFTVTNKEFCLSLHYNGANSYVFVNGTEICKFKTKDSEILVGPRFLGNSSKDWSVDNLKKAGFTGYVYNFSVDYDPATADDIKDIIRKYLMETNNIVWIHQV